MKKNMYCKSILYFMLIPFVFLVSCSKFSGIRTPLYDGQPVKPDEEAIEVYRSSGEVIGAEKDFYLRHPFSADILNQSLDYAEEPPFLLQEGTYLVGEDLPAGRVTLLGNESSFSTESYDVHVGNLVVRDAAGYFYFENLFHSLYGQLTAQVDLIEGHEITVIGEDPEITVFYTERLPENPYLLMDLPLLIESLDRINVQQPLEFFEEKEVLYLTAGIYEVGMHFDAGEYMIVDVEAPHNTEIFLFRGSENPRVIELLLGPLQFMDYLVDEENNKEELEISEVDEKKIELMNGDKIFVNLVNKLELSLLDDKK